MGYHVCLSKHNSKNGLSCLPVKAHQQKWVIMFACQSTTAKITKNSNFPLVTCLLKLCKAACGATHRGSSDTSASASQNWSTKVFANKPTHIQALKREMSRCVSEVQLQLCQTAIKTVSRT